MERPVGSKIISVLFYCLLFSGIAFASYTYKKEILFVLRADAWKIKPCSFVTTYSIGTFDTRFGISKDEFLSDIENATSLWDKPLNRDLFEYKETGGEILVNLIYDKRQKTTDQLEVVSGTISAGKVEYDALKTEYTPLVEKYNEDTAALNLLVTNYKTRISSYNQKVAYWNTQGGAPKAEYAALAQEKNDLNAEADNLTQMQHTINAQLPKINSMVTELNDLIKKYNLSIKTYNTVGSTIGKEFDEGLYEQSLGKRTISIYQFDNDNKLIRVLAHEFGHALGLNHVQDDTDAIMYYLNESTHKGLTTADINELKTVCRVK